MLAAQRLAPRSRVAACAVRTEVSTVLPVACQRLTTQASWRITNTLASDCAPSTSGRPFSGSSAWHSRSTSRRYRMANASVGSLPQSHRGQAELSTSGTPGPNPEPDVNKPSLVSKYCRQVVSKTLKACSFFVCMVMPWHIAPAWRGSLRFGPFMRSCACMHTPVP